MSGTATRLPSSEAAMVDFRSANGRERSDDLERPMDDIVKRNVLSRSERRPSHFRRKMNTTSSVVGEITIGRSMS
jgi:hypothetical protein